ncbi:unnamed protein product [Calicophoron daubneyi]|uniref:non-specific serine/threonine protein kinase n=1 Tax=Calicophoron daubneyi TaxID=300641 RepID=A0AAV2TKL1_CALDB
MSENTHAGTDKKPESLDDNISSPPNPGVLVYQGAEARLYASELYTSTCPRSCIVKERFVKRYRHPMLDSSLSIQRNRAEVRLLLHCRRLGIDVPPVLQIDVRSRRIWLGRIGPNALTLLEWFKQLVSYCSSNVGASGDEFPAVKVAGKRLERLVSALGRLLARLHANHVIHGDLTMANILIRSPTPAEESGLTEPRLALIDFGLSSMVSHTAAQRLPEEKAVDLYVFERALINAIDKQLLADIGSEFPEFKSPETLIQCILDAYRAHYPEEATVLRQEEDETKKKAKQRSEPTKAEQLRTEVKMNLTKLDEVRLRGRKRVMVG